MGRDFHQLKCLRDCLKCSCFQNGNIGLVHIAHWIAQYHSRISFFFPLKIKHLLAVIVFEINGFYKAIFGKRFVLLNFQKQFFAFIFDGNYVNRCNKRQINNCLFYV